MSSLVGSPDGSLRLHEALVQHGPAYLERFGATMPARQRAVLQKLLQCRTAALGGALHQCPQCGQRHFTYHSCNDRHCPQCGREESEEWLAAQQALLLPVPYFLVTFTVPEPLRAWLRSHPALGYDLLFDASAQALQDLAGNPKRLGATLGMLGVLHTWSRTLIHHPHVHFLVAGGGLSRDQRTWVSAKPNFLLPVKALSDRCRNLFRHTLQKENPEALRQIPASTWKQRWVVHSAAVGSGANALRYLSRYVFKTATGNRALPVRPDGRLRWRYRDSATRAWRHVDLEPFELLRRFLQHVLPRGFHRVRRFGWWHPGGRKKRNRVRALLRQKPVLTEAEQAAWQPPAGDVPEPADSQLSTFNSQPLKCARCGAALVLVDRWRPGQRPQWRAQDRAPP
ncbi:MAG TPA: transposase [Candidatus Acidoferrales bacterium]